MASEERVAVAVIGGGPAGAVTALLLARAGLEVTVFDRSVRPRLDRGELLAPRGRSLLTRLGLWNQLPSALLVPQHSMRIAWHSGGVAERSSITDPYGCGWYVRRPMLDECLLEEAARAGVRVVSSTYVRRVIRGRDHWFLELDGARAQHVLARMVVDASGRSIRRRHWSGAQRKRQDRLCAVVAEAALREPAQGLLVEAVPNGWCYSSPTANNNGVVAFVSDADLLVSAGRGRSAITAAIDAAVLTRQRVAHLCGAITTSEASTTSLEPSAGNAWLAVGDALLAHEPLAGHGILSALDSAVEAARAAHEYLAGDVQALQSYSTIMRARILEHLSERRAVYAAQDRWRGWPFWRRRSDSRAEPAVAT